MKSNVGVIVGRFQVAELTSAQVGLINRVKEQSDRVIIFLGCSQKKNTAREPLDYETRRQMISSLYPEFQVYPIDDHPSDVVWSKELDDAIRRVVTQNESVILWGGRDSFVECYSGKFNTEVWDTTGTTWYNTISGTTQREEIAVKPMSNAVFRRGVIYASQNRYGSVNPTVDVAIHDASNDTFLFGRKTGEKGWRFIGGFVDIGDNSLEFAAKREALEETGLEVGDLRYIGSTWVSDWRYGKEPKESVITTLFLATRIMGVCKASDDIQEVRWFSREAVLSGNIDMVSEHTILYDKLITYINNNGYSE